MRPDVTLGEYKGLEVEAELQKVTDEMVDARIDEDRKKASRTIDVEDRPVQEGDTVNLDYAGSVDGVPFAGGTAQGQTLTIGSHQFIPGFEEQMIGMQLGEEKDLNVKFPDEYHAEELKGKDAVFHVKVNGIQVTEVPELDDDFAADVSEFDTFKAYIISRILTIAITAMQGQYSNNIPLMMTGGVIAMIPMLVLFIFGQRHFLEGIARSGVKG